MSNELIEQSATEVATISPEVQALLDQAAKEQAENEQTSIPFISLKGKKFAIGDDKLGNMLKVIILADVFDHSWYDRAYDASSDEVFPPACFAIGNDVNEMAPDPTSPVPQSDSCSTCALNEFGSKGKGKACRNGRRILIASVDDKGRANFGDLAIINMSPTALKGFSKYVKSINTIKKLPLWAVITSLSFDDDAAYPVLVPAYEMNAAGADIEIIAGRLQEFAEYVSVPYDTSTYVAPEAVAESTAKKSKMS